MITSGGPPSKPRDRTGTSPAWRRLLLSSVLLVVTCESSSGPQTATVVLSVQGQVVDADDGSPIPNAQVVLGIGGHFSFPQTVATTTADARGNFTIKKQVTFQRGYCGYWIGGSAVGYVTYDPAFTVTSLGCVPAVQSIIVKLRKQG